MAAFCGPHPAFPFPQVYRTRNTELIQAAAYRHIPLGAVVADVTYGLGNFWAGVKLSWVSAILTSDLAPRRGCMLAADFRALPYRDGSLDVVVIDPPYLPGKRGDDRNAGGLQVAENYALTDVPTWPALMHRLYEPGMAEAARVLKPGGQLWVKGMNLRDHGSGRTLDSQGRICDMAGLLGFTCADKFVLRRAGMSGHPLGSAVKESFLLILARP